MLTLKAQDTTMAHHGQAIILVNKKNLGLIFIKKGHNKNIF